MATKPLHGFHTFAAICRALAVLLKEESSDCAPERSSEEAAHPSTEGLVTVKQDLGPAGL